MELNVGDVIKMKKGHPCGSAEWVLLRVGADCRIKCMGCGHMLMLPRKKLEKSIRSISREKA